MNCTYYKEKYVNSNYRHIRIIFRRNITISYFVNVLDQKLFSYILFTMNTCITKVREIIKCIIYFP